MDEYSHLKYIYEFGPGSDTTVDTSFVNDMSEIDTQIISQTPTKSVTYSKYPKGFELLVEAYAGLVIYRTNFPLKEVRPDKFEIQFPE